MNIEIHRQTCQSCGGKSHQNLLVRSSGQHDKVFVQCSKCKSFVARYTLSDMGYYHHGKGIESFMRNLESSEEPQSGKNLMEHYNSVSEEAQQNFLKILNKLKEMDKD